MSDSAEKTDPWEKYRREQIIRFAKETTPAQRLRLLEEMLYSCMRLASITLHTSIGSTKAISGEQAKAHSNFRIQVQLTSLCDVDFHDRDLCRRLRRANAKTPAAIARPTTDDGSGTPSIIKLGPRSSPPSVI